MKSKLIALIVALMLPMCTAMAQDNMKDLKLKLADLQDQLDELDERLEVTEQHTVLDKINFSFELRSRVDSLSFEDMRGLPGWASTMMGLWSFNRLAVPAGEIGGVPMGSGSGYTFNPAFVMANQELLMGMMPAMMQMGFIDGNGFVDMNGNASFDMYDMPMIGVNSIGAPFFSNRFGASDMALYQMMFQNVGAQPYDYDNDVMYTTRLRINMESHINENLWFGGRLTMYKVWGNGAETSFFNGNRLSANGFLALAKLRKQFSLRHFNSAFLVHNALDGQLLVIGKPGEYVVDRVYAGLIFLQCLSLHSVDIDWIFNRFNE